MSATENIHFLDHKKALDSSHWPKDIKSVINFAYDPVIRKGEYSDLDYQYAQIATKQDAAYIMLSSRAVYGVPDTPTTLTEEHNFFDTVTPYGHTKRLIENKLQEDFDHITILRLGNIFGFEYRPEKPRPTFFGAMLQNLKEQGGINFSMSALTQRDFLPIEIFVQNLLSVANDPQTGIFNMGAGFGTKCGDVAGWVIEGYADGILTAEKTQIIDSFILDMSKTNTAYGLNNIDTNQIKNACVDIGKQLQEM